MLVDGHSIVHRAFYGVPDLTNASGLHVNAIYGFLNILFKLMDDIGPDHLCVAFDTSAPTFRHEKYAEYKGTRKPMPDELREQIPVLKDVLKSMDITLVEHEGWEADDILGSLAKKAEKDGMDVSLVSGDRDLLQIASDKIAIVMPRTVKGKTETEIYHATDVLAKYSVTPLGIIELKALMGDASDNIPGVPKVGEKTATSLLVKYGTVENIYYHLCDITKKGLHDTLEQNRDKAELSRWLATIKTDCDTGVTWDNLELKNLYTDKAYELLKTLGLRKILERFDARRSASADPGSAEASATDITHIDNIEALQDLLKRTSGLFAFYIHDGEDKTVPGDISITTGEGTYVIGSGMPDVLDYICNALMNDEIRPVTFDIKRAYRYLEEHMDISATNIPIDDMMLMQYLINPLGDRSRDIKPGYISRALYEDYETTEGRLESEEMYELYKGIELPLSFVLYDLEKTGIAVDKERLREYGESLNGHIERLTDSIYEAAGMPFNINSPKQLGEVLFERMGISGGKKTKTGYSTSADVLEKLAPEYPIVKDILEYRAYAKLKSTYADGLMDCIAEDGRIHTTFNQTVTATGRISSTEPNLQNIPIRTKLGREIRKAFVPAPGYVFIDADYSQIELRLLAHMSGDEGLIEAYGMDADIHRITASKVFHIPFDEVTPENRRDAKAVNFGLVYGISSFGLSQDLGISRKEAAEYIEEYFATYPGVKAFLDGLVADAKTKGYVTTMYGRRRPIPELKSSNYMMRQFGERVAMNSPIQGSAADIMKIAMINVYKALKDSGIDGRILVQVHDELLLEVRKEDAGKASDILKNMMESAADLKVKLEVDIHEGDDWYNAK